MAEQPDKLKEYEYVEKRYEAAINYYSQSSKNNKRAYKWTRILTIVMGALVTLLASLSSAEFIVDTFWENVFNLSTPIFAACLSIIAGFSQTFHWGSAWQDMVLTAQSLERERDRFHITNPEKLDLANEIDLLNEFVLEESKGFFERMLGGGSIKRKKSELK
jgi:uncharacterized membrane protein YcjF (UPF0283 family)